MKILAIDIGAGTQDILLFDSRMRIENCASLVLPTPSKIFAEKLKRMEGDVYIYGDTIGGGSLIGAALRHMKKGHRVAMEERAAYSIRNDLDEVKSMGIEIGTREQYPSFQTLEIREIDLPFLREFFSRFEESLDVDAIGIAVQDHGVAPKGVSDRAFRFENMEKMLRKDNRPEAFHYSEDSVPAHYLRMKSAVNAVRKTSSAPLVVMDTAFSAILGCMDEGRGPSLVVNAGNGHTIAALIVEGRIEGLYEHHTHELTPQKLENELRRFIRGELTNKEVFEENGHGAVTLRPFSGDPEILVTGPNREIFKGTSLNFVYAAPAGSTMMTGPMGLIKATKFRLGK